MLKEITDVDGLSLYLGIQLEVFKKIEADYPLVNRQRREVIAYWKNNFSGCSWETLAAAVERMGEHANLVTRLKDLAAKSQQMINNVQNVVSEQGKILTIMMRKK